jgi:hypothetical protein
MEIPYHKLNKKLDALTNRNLKHNDKQNVHDFEPRIINLLGVRFTKEQIQTLSLGPNYAIEEELKRYINELIVDTENAIQQIPNYKILMNI